MAATTEPLTLHEGADLVVQAIPEPTDASNEPSSPVAQKTESNRLQRRFDKLTRTIHEQRERADLAEARLAQEQAHATDLVRDNDFLQAENRRLLIDVKAATELISQFRAELARARGVNRGR